VKQEKKTKTSKWTHFSNRCKMAGEQQALEKKGYIVDSPFVPRRKDHVNVYVRISIVRIGDIDTVRQEFQCEIYMRLRWTEEKFKHMDDSEKNRTTWESMWDPRHFFNNATKLDENKTVKEFRDPQVVYRCYVTGIFKEVFTINNFPFDYQKLSLLLSAKCLADQVTFLKDPEKEDNIRTENFFAPQEWNLCSHVLTESKKSEEKTGASSNRYPHYEIRMNVRRQYKFYIDNVFLVMFLITTLSFGSFAVEADATVGRIKISLTLLLTSVAFKYYVQQFVPTVSYLTLIDKYILYCIEFQFFITVHSMIGGLITNSKALSIFEWISFGTSLFAFVAINVYFGHLSWVCIKKAKKSEADNKAEYDMLNPKQAKGTKESAKVGGSRPTTIEGRQVLKSADAPTKMIIDRKEEVCENAAKMKESAYAKATNVKVERSNDNSGQMGMDIPVQMAKDNERKLMTLV